MDDNFVTLLAIGAMVFNFLYLLHQRRKLKRSDEADMSNVPIELLKEVEQQIEDGYVLSSVSNTNVRLIKTRRYWFSLFLLPFLPNAINTFFNSSFVCNIYGVELSIDEQGVQLSTF